MIGAEGSRTLGLCSAIAALSQLSYRPSELLYFTGQTVAKQGGWFSSESRPCGGRSSELNALAPYRKSVANVAEFA